ncbi:hypothetical protein [Alkalilimnicola ehrlichii]|uniref:hypothetical protein n=1 Tax=Alkalilimnicola ehrlichii TaxID=351052 RepID=UPI003B9F79B6
MTWITPHAAVSEYGIPLERIEAAILAGEIAVRVACGARVIDRAEAEALRLKMMLECRETCDDC